MTIAGFLMALGSFLVVCPVAATFAGVLETRWTLMLWAAGFALMVAAGFGFVTTVATALILFGALVAIVPSFARLFDLIPFRIALPCFVVGVLVVAVGAVIQARTPQNVPPQWLQDEANRAVAHQGT